MCKRAIVGLLGLCLSLFSNVASADTKLAMKFKAGEVQKLKMTQKQTQNLTVPGQPAVKTQMTQTMDLETACDEVDSSGVAKLRQKFPRLQMSMELPPPLNQKLNYDTDAAAPNDPILGQMDKIIRPMIGKEMTMKCDLRGQISDFKIPESALAGLKGNPLGQLGGDMFSEAGMKQMVEQMSLSFPDKPLKIGDKWTRASELKSPIGKMTTTMDYSYLGKGEKSDQEKIGVKMKVELEPDPESKLPIMAKLKSSDGKGEILFDNQLGRLVRSQVKSTMEMELSAGGQTFQQNIEVDVLVEAVTAK